MKIVKIIGGLGNQMFQYAFFIALKKTDKNVKMDVSSFQNYTLHQGFELKQLFGATQNEFALIDEIASLKDTQKQFSLRKNIGKLLFSKPGKFIKKSHLIQANYSQYDSTLKDLGNIYYDGYWQSEKFFGECKQQIINVFKWKIINKKNRVTAEKMQSENSVAIHIRRFDSPKNLKELYLRLRLVILWRVCSQKYYLNALSYITENVDNPKVYIFTDNINWVKSNIPQVDNYKIVDWNRSKDSHYDMYLMSQCKHNVISMSSFSWWGAWLNDNPEKIVVAPKKWAVRFTKDIDLIPQEWKRM